MSGFFVLIKSKKIATVEELVKFLDKVDESILEKVGIEALLRGTTRSSEGILFSGNANFIVNGASTSTDSIRAVIFGIEPEFELYLLELREGLKEFIET